MRCEKARKLMSLYQDGYLAPGLAQQLDAHLQQCSACAAEMQSLQRLRSLLRDLPQESPPPYLSQRVMTGIASGNLKPARRIAWPNWVSLGAVATVALWLGISSLLGSSLPGDDGDLLGGIQPPSQTTEKIGNTEPRTGIETAIPGVSNNIAPGKGQEVPGQGGGISPNQGETERTTSFDNQEPSLPQGEPDVTEPPAKETQMYTAGVDGAFVNEPGEGQKSTADSMLRRQGKIDLAVASPWNSFQLMRADLAAVGGYPEQLSSGSIQRDAALIAVSLKVPVHAWADILDKLRSLGEVLEQDFPPDQDVLAEYIKAKEEVERLEQQEKQLRQITSAPETELAVIRKELDTNKALVAKLEEESHWGSLEVTLKAKP